jgi:ApaG protein
MTSQTPNPVTDTPYLTETRGVRIAVKPEFDRDHSNIAANAFVYVYTITISNTGSETVQLLSRHWVIRDAFNEVKHVVGEGVVGQQPTLKPGEAFTYSSYCPLPTPTGSMQGSFQMKILSSQEIFDAAINEFHLKHLALVN